MKPEPVKAFRSIRDAQHAGFVRFTEYLPPNDILKMAVEHAKLGERLAVATFGMKDRTPTYALLRERHDKLERGQVWRALSGRGTRTILSIDVQTPLYDSPLEYRIGSKGPTWSTTYRKFYKWAKSSAFLEAKPVRK